MLPTPQGFPASIGSNNPLYHYYDVTRGLGCADAGSVSQGLINNPTPGNSSPASESGILNNAVVPFFPLNNLVKSYLTTDLNTGAPLVVNMTGPGSLFGPGYVARFVQNGTAHTVGEGLSPLQSTIPISPFPLAQLIQDAANEALWGRQMSKIIGSAKSGCGCSH